MVVGSSVFCLLQKKLSHRFWRSTSIIIIPFQLASCVQPMGKNCSCLTMYIRQDVVLMYLLRDLLFLGLEDVMPKPRSFCSLVLTKQLQFLTDFLQIKSDKTGVIWLLLPVLAPYLNVPLFLLDANILTSKFTRQFGMQHKALVC